MRELNYKEIETNLVYFIQSEFLTAGFTKAVIGMSGGIDSACSAALAVKALGNKNVHAILMPYNKIKKSIKDDVTDAKKICKHLGIDYHIVDITEMVDASENMMNDNVKFDKRTNATNCPNYMLRKGNIMARMRMVTLFDYSSANRALVLGTENLTESASKTEYNDKNECIGYGGFGYFTMFGDSASCIEPISQLYKTEVFELAKHLGLPEFVINKKPSARLWDDHEDEKEMGISYDEADLILYFINEEKWGSEHFKTMGFNMDMVNKVFELKKKGAFKSNIPVHYSKSIIDNCII